jgi:nickel-type superoxide dismutase maturation protease
MLPLLAPGEWWIARRTKLIRPGDLVVFTHPADRVLVKRAIRIESGGWWVEGVNPGASVDSRQFGPIRPDRIIGRLVWRLLPWSPREARAILRNNRG